MFPNIKDLFISAYNQRVPNWKKLTPEKLINTSRLSKTLDSIEIFIKENNLDSQRLVNSIIDFFLEKDKKFPYLFYFKGASALTIYKNYKLANILTLSETQEILNFVKKSKKLLKNLENNGIIYSRGVFFLKEMNKVSPYFLLAHGITNEIPQKCIEKWKSEELKNLVLNIIFEDRG